MKSRGFTLIELLVVIAIIAILASIILVSVMRVQIEAQKVKTASLINDYKLGIEKYYSNVHKYPFIADANGDFNVDDCWREMAPLSVDLTAGKPPSDPLYRNKKLIECLSLQRDQMIDPGDGFLHVVDSWKKQFSMQWDYFNKKAMIWSAGDDMVYDISDDKVLGGHSSLFSNQAQAKTNTPPLITQPIKDTQIDLDLSNY